MLQYRLSENAETDVLGIADYTLDTWGMNQALKYSDNLYDHYELLGQRPALGRRCVSLSPGLSRFEVEKHVVFFLEQVPGILVVRVMHESILPLPRYFSDSSAPS